MPPNANIVRQLWGAFSTSSAYVPHCTPFTLPSGGVLAVNESVVVTLTRNAQFSPQCTGGSSGAIHGLNSDNSTVINFHDPFYASIAPQVYAIATATVISYLLVIIIFITPRAFYNSGAGRGGMMGGSYSTSSAIGVGRRPWLQKIATLTVAISLTIATADVFSFAKGQYDQGYSDAGQLVSDVVGGIEIRIVRVISDTFLWLAQVQTLIRLFPRHKEKVTIKWLGFGLILLDTVFGILNNFVYQSVRTRPRSFQDAIPALSYLFDLAIGLIYASCVIYYSLSKLRFAFWHAKMRNICLVALLSLTAVLIPVVFFVLDISKPDVAGWGNWFRWVGAAAASVVVWEWVERIEALERDERKDGILGREVFDGDEMLEVTPSEEVEWPGDPQHRHNGHGHGQGEGSGWKYLLGYNHRPLRSRIPFSSRHGEGFSAEGANNTDVSLGALQNNDRPAPTAPQSTLTPVSRADTSSASTIYAIHCHSVSSPSPPVPDNAVPFGNGLPKKEEVELQRASQNLPSDTTSSTADTGDRNADKTALGEGPKSTRATLTWRAVPNPFKRRRASPPAEVAGAQIVDEQDIEVQAGNGNSSHDRPSLRSRAQAFGVAQRSRMRARNNGHQSEIPMPVTVIPAQRRGQRTWSPDDLASSANGVSAGVDSTLRNSWLHEPRSLVPTLPQTIIPAVSRNQRVSYASNPDSPGLGQASCNGPIVHPYQGAALSPIHSSDHPCSANGSSAGASTTLERTDGPSSTTPAPGPARRGTVTFSVDEGQGLVGANRRASRTSPRSIPEGSPSRVTGSSGDKASRVERQPLPPLVTANFLPADPSHSDSAPTDISHGTDH